MSMALIYFTLNQCGPGADLGF